MVEEDRPAQRGGRGTLSEGAGNPAAGMSLYVQQARGRLAERPAGSAGLDEANASRS
jgi:hypothetical protein